jgi:hypothetical protein
MYGCSNAVLVYGFNIGDQEYIIDNDYLEDKFSGISEYAVEVVRNCLCEAVYGIYCVLDKETGQAIISDEKKAKVKKLYDKYVEYLKNQLSESDFEYKMKAIKFGFCLVVSGDYETCQDTIILDDDWGREEEEEKNNELDKEAYIVRELFAEEYTY